MIYHDSSPRCIPMLFSNDRESELPDHHSSNKDAVRILSLILINLCLVSCGKFDQEHLLSKSFGADLESISSGKKTKYSDGLFIILNVLDTEPVYSRFFAEPFKEGDVSLKFGDTEFNSAEVGKIRYRFLESFDGYTKTIFYIPKQKLLGFGYSDGVME